MTDRRPLAVRAAVLPFVLLAGLALRQGAPEAPGHLGGRDGNVGRIWPVGDDDEYIFCREDGKQLDKNGLEWRVGQVFKTAGLPAYDPSRARPAR